MSYAGDQPRVFLLNLETGQREIVGEFPGMTFAPRFSPDGQRVIMSLQNGGNSDIYEMDLRSQQHAAAHPRQGDRHEPELLARWPPDRVRDRPRRHAADLRDERRRLQSAPHQRRRRPLFDARSGRRAATTSPSPSRLGGRFLIGVMRPDGSGERVLTEGFHNEGPTWAPNGRVIMFFRESPGADGRSARSFRSISRATTSARFRPRRLLPTRRGRRC